MASSTVEAETAKHNAPPTTASKPDRDVPRDDEKEDGEESEEDEGSEYTGQGQSSPSSDEQAPPASEQPPLPDEAPPLPSEQLPDDGWEPVWDAAAHAFYFFNRFTKATQWENPRVPTAAMSAPPGAAAAQAAPDAGLGAHNRIGDNDDDDGDDDDDTAAASASTHRKKGVAGGYNPAIHGDYDPNADYAQDVEEHEDKDAAGAEMGANAAGEYAATGAFNRFTGKWQDTAITPENFNDENKSKRQMNAFFDVDAAANSHDGRSLKAERQNKKFSRKEIKAFKEKRRERKEEKRRAWLRD